MRARLILGCWGRARPSRDEDDVLIDFVRRSVSRCGMTVYLPPARFRLLATLAAASRPLPVRDIVDALYGDDPDGGPVTADRVIDVHLCHLRRGLAPLGLGFHRQHWRGLALIVSDLPSADLARRAA